MDNAQCSMLNGALVRAETMCDQTIHWALGIGHCPGRGSNAARLYTTEVVFTVDSRRAHAARVIFAGQSQQRKNRRHWQGLAPSFALLVAAQGIGDWRLAIGDWRLAIDRLPVHPLPLLQRPCPPAVLGAKAQALLSRPTAGVPPPEDFRFSIDDFRLTIFD